MTDKNNKAEKVLASVGRMEDQSELDEVAKGRVGLAPFDTLEEYPPWLHSY